MTWFGTRARQQTKQRGCPELTSIDLLDAVSITDMINIMTNCNCSNELLELRRELMRQWFTNHAEHCGVTIAPPCPPHEGDCQWTIPPVIQKLPPNEVYLLLLEASGESFGLQL